MKYLSQFIVCMLMLVSLAGVLSVAVADNESDYRKSIDDIGTQISKISRNLNANKKLLKNEQDRLFETEKKLSAISRAIADTKQKLTFRQTEIEALETQRQQTQASQAQNKEALKTLLQNWFKQGKTDYVKQLLNQENPYAVGRLNNYHRYFSQALRARFDELEGQLNTSRELNIEHQKALSELVIERDKQTQQEQAWLAANKRRTAHINKLNKKVNSSQDQLAKLKKDRARLNSLLKQIAAKAAELKRLAAAREAQRLKNQTQPSSNTKPVARTKVKGGFIKQKGRLSFPVSTVAKTKFGSRLPASGMRSEGIFYDTKTSQPVKSIFRGRVLFADFLKGYGLLIIVDHGDDHISLYGHNELLYKQVGDTVDTNEVIAKTGKTGGLKSAGLYFEIRHNAVPINPTKWCR